MTYQIEANCPGNRMQPFLVPPEVTKGQKSKISNIGQLTYQVEGNCTGNLMDSFLAPPKDTQGHQYSRTQLAQRASTLGPNWPAGPVQRDQTGPEGQ